MPNPVVVKPGVSPVIGEVVTLTTDNLPIKVAEPPCTLKDALEQSEIIPIPVEEVRHDKRQMVLKSRTTKFWWLFPPAIISLTGAITALLCTACCALLAAALLVVGIVNAPALHYSGAFFITMLVCFIMGIYFYSGSIVGTGMWRRTRYQLYPLKDIPDEAKRKVRMIRSILRGQRVEFFVDTFAEDPYILARYKRETVFFHKW